MLDKTDPIIAIWRYMAVFRHKIDPGRFLAAMEDFFENPTPQRSCFHPEILELIVFLQDRRNAAIYMEDGLPALQKRGNHKLMGLFTRLVHRPESMHYVSPRGRKRDPMAADGARPSNSLKALAEGGEFSGRL